MNPHLRSGFKSKVIYLSCAALIFAGGVSAAFANYVKSITRQVTLNDDGYVVQIETMTETVGELLNQYGIALAPEDEIKPGLDQPITSDMAIEITRAFKASVIADGNIKNVYLTKGIVKDVLGKANVLLGEQDLISRDLQDQVQPGALIRVTRMEEEIVVEKEAIPYQVITRKNHNLDEGVEKVVQEGSQGEKQRQILVAYRDGIEVERRQVSEEISVEPVDRVIDRGTVRSISTSRGDMVRYSKVETFRATAYTHTGNRTRTGVWPEKGMIAVDPRVIPLHSRVYVEFPKGWEHLNGFYKAMDTGGAIKGDIIDVFLENESIVRQFGRRKVKIYFLK